MAPYKTFQYKKIDNCQPFLLDVYFPPHPPTDEIIKLPVLVHFHGGALLMGNRQSALPNWLLERTLASGCAFISADYRCLIPATAHEIVEDLKDVFKYVATSTFKGDDYAFRLDGDRIGVCGNSAGGLCAYLATIHCSPRPKVLASIYGQGGDFFTEHNLLVKEKITFMGQPVDKLDPSLFSTLTYPFPDGMPMVTDVPFGVDPSEWEDPAAAARQNPRMTRYNLFLQEGNYLDYYTGLHDPSISKELRKVLNQPNPTAQDFKDLLPEDKHALFPQLSIDSSWPPTILIHGTADDVVPAEESRNIKKLVEEVGATVQLIEVEGLPHGYDGFPGMEESQKDNFDAVSSFVQKYLG